MRAQAERAAAGHRVERVLHEVEQRLAQLAGDAAHDRAPRLARSRSSWIVPPRARSAQSGRVIATTSSHTSERSTSSSRSRLQRLLANESADARRGRGAGLRRLRDAHRVVAHRGRIVGVRLEEIRRRHDRIERVVHVVHHAGSELADRGEPAFARPRFLEREQLCVRSWTIRSRRSASVETRSYSSAVRRASSSSALASCVFTVTSRSTVTAPRIFPCSS